MRLYIQKYKNRLAKSKLNSMAILKEKKKQKENALTNNKKKKFTLLDLKEKKVKENATFTEEMNMFTKNKLLDFMSASLKFKL